MPYFLSYLLRECHRLGQSGHGDAIHEIEDSLKLPRIADVSKEDGLLGDGGEARCALVEELLVARGEDRQTTQLSRTPRSEDLYGRVGRDEVYRILCI